MESNTLEVQDLQDSKSYLLSIFAQQEKPVIYSILRHVSASGMSRDISFFTILNNEKLNLTYSIATVLGEKVRNTNGFNTLRVQGVGMDMGFHVVYSLSSCLYLNIEGAGYILRHEWA